MSRVINKKKNKEQPFCGFAVTPKYPVNTRLRKHFPGHGDFTGRVTGFDGEFYEILYDDGDAEVFDVSGFDAVEILAPDKQQQEEQATAVGGGGGDGRCGDGEDPLVALGNFVPIVDMKKPKYEVPTCPICTEEFTCDTSNRESGRLPIQAIHCPHVICKECVAKIHLTGLQDLKGGSGSSRNNSKRKFVDCPICKRSKSFNIQEPTVCLTMCEMVELCHKINQQKVEPSSTDVSTEIRRRRMLRAAEERYEAVKRQRFGEAKPEALASLGKTGANIEPEAATPLLPAAPDPAPSSLHAENNNKNIPPVLICSGCRTARKLKKFPEDQVKRGVKNHRADVYCKDCLVTCSCCHVTKPKDKYSSKQLGQSKFSSSSLPKCRRCEDKTTIRKRFGHKLQNITIQIATKNPFTKLSQKSHLATVVQWPIVPLVDQQHYNHELPDNLTLDGYSREAWALLENNPDNVWSTVTLLMIGGKAAGFLKFLTDHQKAAYATFNLPSGQDGFFVIPHDQPPQVAPSIGDNGEATGTHDGDIFIQCKYVIGLGLDLGKQELPDSGTHDVSEQEGTPHNEEDYMSASKLSNLLSKVSKTDKAIAAMPQAIARKYIQTQNALARPDLPVLRPGGGDWYRPCTMTIRKHDDEC